jgi:hypothetical protein
MITTIPPRQCIRYAAGYKYQLRATCAIQTTIKPPAPIRTEYISLDDMGVLTIREGYAWDGPSGPTIDTLDFMRPSLAHDGLYQLMREGHLDHLVYRQPADQELRRLCLEDGMSRVRAWWVYQGVRLFGDPCADPADKAPDQCAPAGCECEGTATSAEPTASGFT